MARLRAEMILLQAKLNKKRPTGALPISFSGTKWEDVQQDIGNLAADMRDTKGRGTRFIYKFGTHATAFENWFDVLPAGDYGSLIKGAFGLVVKASALETPQACSLTNSQNNRLLDDQSNFRRVCSKP